MLLDVRSLSKAFPIESGLLRQRTGSVQALRNVSLQITQGETVALVGGSGCGKSTLAKIIAGLLSADSGEVHWEGQDLMALTRIERAKRIQMVFQDPFASLNPKLSVLSQLGEVIRLANPGMGDAQVVAEASAVLDSVRLSGDVLNHYPFQFSGGQRQRIAIARALAMKPALLIADEPLSALDVTIQAQVLDLLRDLKKRLGLTLLFITHDLAVVSHFADRVLVMQDGQLIEGGVTATLLSNPQQAYTRALIDAVPRLPC